MDRLEVINEALLKAGLPLAADLSDCDWNAQAIYEAVVTRLLRAHAWSFAMRLATLNQTTAPTFGFKYAYHLPDDCLKVIDVHCFNDLRSPKARYIVQGKRLLCNVMPCNCRYVGTELEPETWNNDFAEAVSCKIAMEIVALSGQNMGIIPQLAQLYNLALANAEAADARECTERVPIDQSLIVARTAERQ